jgi:hypothetical protein
MNSRECVDPFREYNDPFAECIDPLPRMHRSIASNATIHSTNASFHSLDASIHCLEYRFGLGRKPAPFQWRAARRFEPDVGTSRNAREMPPYCGSSAMRA